MVGLESSEVLASISVEARSTGGAWTALGPVRDMRALEKSPAGLLIPLAWPEGVLFADQFRITLELRDSALPVRIHHVALYPPSRPAISKR